MRYYRRPSVKKWATDVATEPRVTWPDKETVTNGTIVVLVAGTVATLYVAVPDRFWGTNSSTAAKIQISEVHRTSGLQDRNKPEVVSSSTILHQNRISKCQIHQPAQKMWVQDQRVQSGAAPMKWYVATTYSNYENKVKAALQERIRQFKMESLFGEILIPTEQITETLKSASSARAAASLSWIHLLADDDG